jgi:hypothetical protein
MRVLDEQPNETIHLYVVAEDQLPQKPDYLSIGAAIFAVLCIFAIIAISVFSATPTEQEVTFTISIQGFHLAPVARTVKTTVVATGKGHTPATSATGIITFYNGLPYTQIVPIGTRLTGADGESVITDQQAVIPPAAQTAPPTYGHTGVSAHALVAGVQGNIPAGDINIACCATSIIAQNPYNFTDGRNARDFTYLTQQDVTNATSSLLPTLHASTLLLLPNPRLNSSCSTTSTSSPHVGKEAKSAQLAISETCSADSYSEKTVAQAITTYSKKFGKGTLTHAQFIVVSVSEKRGVTISLYVVGRWHPFVMRSFPNVGK